MKFNTSNEYIKVIKNKLICSILNISLKKIKHIMNQSITKKCIQEKINFFN